MIWIVLDAPYGLALSPTARVNVDGSKALLHAESFASLLEKYGDFLRALPPSGLAVQIFANEDFVNGPDWTLPVTEEDL